MKTKLTIAKIKTAKVPSGKTEIKLWDSLVTGLYLRISASGGRRWYYRYRTDSGEVRPLKIGDYPTLPIDSARDAAKAHAGQVAKGHDPARIRQEKRRREAATLGKLLAVDGSYERALKARRIVKTKEALSSLRRGLANLMSTDIAKVSRLDLVEAMNALNGLPGAKNELRKCARTLLEWTTNSGLTQANVLAGMRLPPKTRAERLEEVARRRALTDSDIVAVWRAAEACGKFGSLVQLGLLTGMRRGELATLRWADIAADRILLSAAVTKTSTPHQVPLTGLMRSILKRQPRTTSPLVFPSDTTGRAMTGWVKMKARIVREANVGAWTLHDLRRTCRTLMTRCGVAEPVAEMSIGHAKEALVGLYDLAEQMDKRRDAFTRVSNHIGKLVASESRSSDSTI